MRELRWLAVMLAVVSTAAAQRDLSPKLKKGGRRICSIAVLPAQWTIVKFGFRGSQGFWEKNDETEDELTTLVTKMFAGRQAKLVQTPPASELSPASRDALASIQRNYDGVDAQMKRSPGGVAKGRYSLGELPAGYVPAETADTLVFIRGDGRVAANVGGLLTHQPKLRGRVGLVDARTGDVLAFLGFDCDGTHGRSVSLAEGLASHILDLLGQDPSLFGYLAREGSGACSR